MREILRFPSFTLQDEDPAPLSRLKILRAKTYARVSTPPDDRRRAAMVRTLANLNRDPLVWDGMVEDFGNPLEA